MKTHRMCRLGAGALLCGLSAAAQASLIGVLPTTNGGTDYQAYYDTRTDLTWLANADVNGRMDWSTANAWAPGFTVTGYVGGSQINVSGWTLPSVVDTGASGCNFAYSGTDCGYNVQTTSGTTVYSAMASLYFDTLGNLAYYDTSGNGPQTGWGLTNTGPFSNVQPYYYWSRTEYVGGFAWSFTFNAGYQNVINETYGLYAWPVHSGNVGASTVPEPDALGLVGIGLFGVALSRRRRKVKQVSLYPM